jgi:hypothetical protein
MGILDRLKPQPRWKHVDPVVRLESIRELEDAAELATLAETDPDVRVRRAALAKVDEAGVLGRIGSTDADADTRERAADRLVFLACQSPLPSAETSTDVHSPDTGAIAVAAVMAIADPRRLSTVAKGDAIDAVRASALSRITDSRALGSIARHASHENTALAALERLTEVSDLLEVALNAEHKDVALAAFDRLSASLDLAQLRSIEVRSHQKAVGRKAKGMIQEIESAEAARHAAALERQRRESMLTDAVHQLAEVTDIEVARADLGRLSESWSALGVTEPASRERFSEAVGHVESAIVRRQREAEEALERQRARAEAIATREALCVRVETLDGEDVIAQLVPIEEEWRSLLPLVGNGPEADRLAERFARAVAACRKRHEMSAALATARVQLDALVAEAEALTSGGDVDAAAVRWPSLSREARGLTALLHDAGRPADDAVSKLTAVDHVFAAHRSQQQASADQARQAVIQQVNRLAERAKRVADAETVTLREGERLMRDIAAGLETAAAAGSSADLDSAMARLRQAQESVAPRVRELRELDDWRRFANAQRQEQLITMAEAIVASLKAEAEAGQASDLAATARALREMHSQWQEVAEAPRQSAQRLWDRFRLATDFIRSRCETYFQKLRDERQASLEKKTALVTEAEALSASSDWAKTANRMQELQTEWQALARVGRDTEHELSQRFRTACNAFFSRRREDLTDRKKVWTDNLARKEALCERAEALATSSEWDAAASEMKRLQADWKTIGPVRKSRSEAVWNRFRAAADRFFERYHSRHEIALAEKLGEREAIVVELEQLAAVQVDDMPAFAARVQQVRSTWHRSVPVPVPGMKELTDRWQAALSAILAGHPAAFGGTDLDPAAVVQRMEKLVARVEALVADMTEETGEEVSPTELLAAKLRSAFATNAMGGRVNDDTKWRAAADTVKDAQSAWQRLAPIDSPEVRDLEARFRDACRRVHDQTRKHKQTSSNGGHQGSGHGSGGSQPRGARPHAPSRPPRRETASV